MPCAWATNGVPTTMPIQLLGFDVSIGGGLPLSRPDLHFIYNAMEEALILIACVHQVDRLPRAVWR